MKYFKIIIIIINKKLYTQAPSLGRSITIIGKMNAGKILWV